MNEPFIPVLWALVAGAAVACVAYLLATGIAASHAEGRRLRSEGKPAGSASFKLLRPVGAWLGFLVGGASARVEMVVHREAERSFLKPVRLWAEKRLRAAAYPEGVTADEFVGFAVLGGIAGTALGVLVNLRIQFNPIIIPFTLAGMYWPTLWLNSRVHHRQNDIRRGLPYALDLLTISVEAGLDFTQALDRIVRKLGNTPLAMELGATLRDIQLGRTRAQALRNLSRRVDLAELNSLVSALIQADQLGSSLGPILRVQSDQLRAKRSQAAEKRAMEAPVKILLPLILFIFPTIFIMIFGPIVLRFVAKN